MKITHITNFETWKMMGEHYGFDPHEQVDHSIDMGGGNSIDYEFCGDPPEKEKGSHDQTEQFLEEGPSRAEEGDK